MSSTGLRQACDCHMSFQLTGGQSSSCRPILLCRRLPVRKWSCKPTQGLRVHGRRPTGRCYASTSTATELPSELKKIVDLFNMVPDPKLKYQQLLAYGKKLPSMPQEDHTDENKVRGCVSQVWVKPQVRDGKIYWLADSDSALTKGLAALLVQGLSGCRPEEVANLTPDWITTIGLQQSLTPSRNNGFLNMFGLMRHKAAQLLQEQATEGLVMEVASDVPAAESAAPVASTSNNKNGGAESADGKPVRASMQLKLTEALKPRKLAIVDESDQHAGHAGLRMPGNTSGETHFRVSIVSSAFDGLNTVKRHRLVYEVLKDELAGPVHALSLDTKTEQEASS